MLVVVVIMVTLARELITCWGPEVQWRQKLPMQFGSDPKDRESFPECFAVWNESQAGDSDAHSLTSSELRHSWSNCILRLAWVSSISHWGHCNHHGKPPVCFMIQDFRSGPWHYLTLFWNPRC